MIPTDPRNRLHNQHLPHLVCPNNKVCSRAQNQGGQYSTPINIKGTQLPSGQQRTASGAAIARLRSTRSREPDRAA